MKKPLDQELVYGSAKAPRWLKILFLVLYLPIGYVAFRLTQPGQIPGWLLNTAAIWAIAPIVSLAMYLAIKYLSTIQMRRRMLDEIDFHPVPHDLLSSRTNDLITLKTKHVIPSNAKIKQAWRGKFNGHDIELCHVTAPAGNSSVTIFLASLEALPPADTAYGQREIFPLLKRIFPNQNQLDDIGSKHIQNEWSIYGDKDSAHHLLNDSFCELIEQLPKGAFVFIWHHERLYLGLHGVATRDGIYYLFHELILLGSAAQILIPKDV